MKQLKFMFDEEKAVEALAFIAHECPGLTPLFVAKILFYAEKWHLNRYGRPIIADTYIAMPMGPVPSIIKNYLDQKWAWTNKPSSFDEAITIDLSGDRPRLMKGKRSPDLSILSQTDIECLKEAIEFCKSKSASQLSSLTHFEKAWQNSEMNREMNYFNFIDDDNANKSTIIEVAKENSMYHVC